jgi:hypothetical protein
LGFALVCCRFNRGTLCVLGIADKHSAWVAARGLLLGFEIFGSFALFFAVSLAMLPLLPQDFRIDCKGISNRDSSRQDWSTALFLPWREITAVAVERPAFRVPCLKLQTSDLAHKIRFPTAIRVPTSVDMKELTTLIERFHGKAVVDE